MVGVCFDSSVLAFVSRPGCAVGKVPPIPYIVPIQTDLLDVADDYRSDSGELLASIASDICVGKYIPPLDILHKLSLPFVPLVTIGTDPGSRYEGIYPRRSKEYP